MERRHDEQCGYPNAFRYAERCGQREQQDEQQHERDRVRREDRVIVTTDIAAPEEQYPQERYAERDERPRELVCARFDPVRPELRISLDLLDGFVQAAAGRSPTARAVRFLFANRIRFFISIFNFGEVLPVAGRHGPHRLARGLEILEIRLQLGAFLDRYALVCDLL